VGQSPGSKEAMIDCSVPVESLPILIQWDEQTDPNGDIDLQLSSDGRDHPHCKQGVPSKLKKIVVYAYTLHT
jgi:hypothetical protein